MINILYFLAPCVVVTVMAYHGADLPPGPYCGITRECCRNRMDSCSHQILDTLCYCDQHCNRTHDDCCPDYEEVCLGITPEPFTLPPEPQIKGNCYPGQRKMDGCNECSCEPTPAGQLDWQCEREECIISDEVIALVNQGYSTWRAANYSDLAGKKLKDGIVYKLGTFPLAEETRQMGSIQYNKKDVPRHFDARQTWPSYITPVADQGWCGSDWAVAIAGVASDRFAIQSNGIENMELSAQTMLSCNVRGQQGCTGGHIDVAWNFVRFHGLVDEDCFSYEAKVTPCPFKRRDNLVQDGCSPLVQKRTSRYKVGPPGKLNHEQDIMYDIKASGPVHAIMTVYQDFFHYRSGVYRHTDVGNQQIRGLHSVRIVGWGEERGEKYWIVANSWGDQWGEDGYFRILRGTDEVGIESFVITVLPGVEEA